MGEVVDKLYPIDVLAIVTMPFSSGCRKASRTWRRHADRASRKRTPWWARDTSPGIGTWPPPISPHSGDGVVGGATGPGGDGGRMGGGHAPKGWWSASRGQNPVYLGALGARNGVEPSLPAGKDCFPLTRPAEAVNTGGNGERQP